MIHVTHLPHPVTAEGARQWEAPDGASPAELARGLGDVRCVANGRWVPDGEWLLPLPAGSVAWFRTRVAGDDTDPLRTVLQIALLVATFYVGGPLAAKFTWGRALATAGLTIGGTMVINAIAPPPAADYGRDGSRPPPAYALTMGSNRLRPYEPLLLVLGSHRVFPDLASQPYTEFDGAPAAVGTPPLPGAAAAWYGAPYAPPAGALNLRGRAAPSWAPGGANEQYLHQTFDFGIGDLEISDLKLGETALSALQEVEQRWPNATGGLTLDADGVERGAIARGNVDTAPGAALEDTTWHRRATSADTVEVGIDLTGAIFEVSRRGEVGSHSVRVHVEMWPGESEEPVAGKTLSETLTLRHAATTPYRATVRRTVEKGKWQVRLRRAAAPSDSDRVHDDVTWAALRSYQDDPADYAGRNRLAIRVRATGQLSGALDRLSATVGQKVPVWEVADGADEAAWSDPKVSSNPAWIYRQYLLGWRVGTELAAGVGLPAARIDDATLQAWGAWCDAEGLGCNVVIDRDMSHDEALALIARCGRASMTLETGKFGVVWDRSLVAPSAFYGPGNIVAGSLEVDWASGASLAEEIVCRWIDPALDWQWNDVRRNVTGVDAPDRTATLTLAGVTDGEQAAAECNLQAARQLYHRRRLRWRTGPEGRATPRGAVALMSHSLVAGGECGRLLGANARVDAFAAASESASIRWSATQTRSLLYDRGPFWQLGIDLYIPPDLLVGASHNAVMTDIRAVKAVENLVVNLRPSSITDPTVVTLADEDALAICIEWRGLGAAFALDNRNDPYRFNPLTPAQAALRSEIIGRVGDGESDDPIRVSIVTAADLDDALTVPPPSPTVRLDRKVFVPDDVTDTAAIWPTADEPNMMFRLPTGDLHITPIRRGASQDAPMLVDPIPAHTGDPVDILW